MVRSWLMESRFASWWYVAIHQGFFVRPFSPSPYYFLSLLFNKRFRIGTLLGSHLKAPPPFHSLPSFVDVGTNGAVGEGWSRALFIGRGKGGGGGGGGGGHKWLESKAAVLKVSHLFHWPGFEAALYATGSTLSSRLGNSRGRVIPPPSSPVPRNTGDRHPGSRLVLFYYGCPSLLFQAPKPGVLCYREEGRVTIRITREIFLGLEIFASIS